MPSLKKEPGKELDGMMAKRERNVAYAENDEDDLDGKDDTGKGGEVRDYEYERFTHRLVTAAENDQGTKTGEYTEHGYKIIVEDTTLAP
jgi:hypothetical protein